MIAVRAAGAGDADACVSIIGLYEDGLAHRPPSRPLLSLLSVDAGLASRDEASERLPAVRSGARGRGGTPAP